MMGNTRDDDGPAPMMSSPREELRSLDVQRIDAVCGRAALVEQLRRLLPRMEERGAARVLPFGLAAIDGQLPQGGLASAPARARAGRTGRQPAAFGFIGASRPWRGPARDGTRPCSCFAPRLDAFGRPYAIG